MYIVTLAEARKQLADPLEEDNDYISGLIDTAYYAIKHNCNNTTWIDHSGNTNGSTSTPDLFQVDIPITIKHAVLMMVEHLYNNRSPVSFGSPSKIPYTIDILIGRYINYE